MLGMWTVNIPGIKAHTHTSTAELGVALLLMGGCAWVGMQVSGRLVDRFGSARVTVSALALGALTLLGPAFASNTVTLAVALMVLGLVNGGIDVAQNAQAALVERHWGRPIMSSFHAMFSLGGFLASLVGGLLIAAGTPIPLQMALAIVVMVLAIAALRPHLLTHDVRDPEAPAGTKPPWTSQVVLLGVLAFWLMLAEGVAYDWSALHLHTELGADKATASLAYGSFSVAMTVGRLTVDRVVHALGPGRFVTFAALTGAAGLTLVTVAPVIWVALVGWVVFGLGLAGCVPQFFSAAGNIDPAHSGALMSRVVGLGYVGMLAGPSLIGAIAGVSSLNVAFVVPIVGAVFAATLAQRALRRPVAS